MSVLIPIDKLRPDPQNPRRAGVGDVSELAESMASVGVLQPLLVTPDPEVPDGFLVVFGHRRLAGAVAAKLTEVPAEVREIDPVDRLAIQLVENMQRAEIDALELGGIASDASFDTSERPDQRRLGTGDRAGERPPAPL